MATRKNNSNKFRKTRSKNGGGKAKPKRKSVHSAADHKEIGDKIRNNPSTVTKDEKKIYKEQKKYNTEYQRSLTEHNKWKERISSTKSKKKIGRPKKEPLDEGERNTELLQQPTYHSSIINNHGNPVSVGSLKRVSGQIKIPISQLTQKNYNDWRDYEATVRKNMRHGNMNYNIPNKPLKKPTRGKDEKEVADILFQMSNKKSNKKQSSTKELQTLLDNMDTQSLASNDTLDDINDTLSRGTLIDDTDTEDDSPPSRQPFRSQSSSPSQPLSIPSPIPSPISLSLPSSFSLPLLPPSLRRSQNNPNPSCSLKDCDGGKRKTRKNKRK